MDRFGEEPKLQAPGAGIPFFERMVGKYLGVGLMARRSSWEESVALYRKESERIFRWVEKTPVEKLEIRTLVPRLRGLEDSSRYWSVAMTLEHVNIVSSGIAGAIVALSHGRVPPVAAEIARMKPRAGDHSVLVSGFRKSVDEIERCLLRDVGDRRSALRFAHPWFGGMTAHQWVWLLGMHQGIHRRQIQEIVVRLG